MDKSQAVQEQCCNVTPLRAPSECPPLPMARSLSTNGVLASSMVRPDAMADYDPGATLTVAGLIWTSLKPLIRASRLFPTTPIFPPRLTIIPFFRTRWQILVPSLVGWLLVKTGKLGPEGIRNAASIQIYGALPVRAPFLAPALID